EGGRDLIFSINTASVERSGALRAVMHSEGLLTLLDGAPLLDVTARLSFYAGLSTVQVELSVTNPRAARRPGGWWDLGDPGSVLLRELSVMWPPPDGGRGHIRCSADRSAQLAPRHRSLELYQDSSGGENWHHINHVNRLGKMPTAF